MLESFERFDILRAGVRLHGRRGGSGDPLLLLHGHPQSHVMWAQHGAVEKCFDVLALWRERAEQVSGQPVASGHYIAEEAPSLMLADALEFFRS